jgi:nucleotidyltransferase/DNA polymerase involved in DNA repair
MTIKVRYDDFSLVTRRHTSAMPGRDAADIASRAVALLERKKGGPVRLLGAGVHGLLPDRRPNPG